MIFNPYAIPSMISGLMLLIMGIIIYFKNPKNIQNRLYLLFTFFVLLFIFGEAFLRLSDNINQALIVGQITYLGAIFSPVCFFHVDLAITKILTENKTKQIFKKIIIFDYILGFIFYIIFLTITSPQNINLSKWGYRFALNSSLYFIGIYIIANIIVGSLILFNKYFKTKELTDRKQIRSVFYGATIAGVLTISTSIILPLFNIEFFPLATVGLAIMTFFIGVAVLKHSLFDYIPMKHLILKSENIALLNKNELKKEVQARTKELLKVNDELRTIVAEQDKTEKQLKKSLKEKEILMKEIHHRVKNNLQIISSIIYLQSEKSKNNDLNNAITEINDRIRSMSLIHESLYQSEDLERIDFESYLKSLINEIFQSYGIKSKQIELNIKARDINLPIDIAIPSGLIITELVTNSLKHAFPHNMKGILQIDFRNDKNNYELHISDDGIGFPKNMDIQKTETLGLQLVRNLVNQLGGDIEVLPMKGTHFKISFKIKPSDNKEDE